MIYNDFDRFAVFSQLARLLTAEDITVRWNVPGMTSPAAMNPVTRVLSVAPVKEGEEDVIPGLIFHEVAHFLESDDYSKNEGEARFFNRELYNETRGKALKHELWNIIEDGFAERRSVIRWPGSAKHLKVLHDRMKRSWKLTGNVAIDTMNTLLMNVMGVKWGEKFEYDPILHPRLLKLLERARLITGTTQDRVELTNAIFIELSKVGRKLPAAPEVLPDPSELQPPTLSTSLIEDLTHLRIADTLGVVRDAPDVPVDSVGVDNGETQTSEVLLEQTEVAEDVARLEEFLSENTARILGTNSFLMEEFIQRDLEGGVRYIPNRQEIEHSSNIHDIFTDVKSNIGDQSFTTFMRNMESLDASDKYAKTLFEIFLKKVQKAKSVAQGMYQSFASRANALNVAHTRKQNTGVLDPTRASLFAIREDIFRKCKMSPNQPNHGYVVMVDWSSSMKDSSYELVHRVMELHFFAQLAGVELETWLYTTADYTQIKLNAEQFRDKVLLTPSLFVKIAGQCNTNELLFRLFILFTMALEVKERKNLLSGLQGYEKKYRRRWIDDTFYQQMGTNIFEAISFGLDQALKLKAEKKGLILMTDGEDANAFPAVVEAGQMDAGTKSRITRAGEGMIDKVYFGAVELFSFAAAQAEAATDKYQAVFRNFRVAATYLVADEARKRGISVIGVTWELYMSLPLRVITKENVVRLPVPFKDLKSVNPTTYAQVNNTFITSISEALLSNIKA